jgi:hypothetical protein
MATKIPNWRKIDQTAIKYTNIFHCKTLQYLPNLVFLVWVPIWQPCLILPKLYFRSSFDNLVRDSFFDLKLPQAEISFVMNPAARRRKKHLWRYRASKKIKLIIFSAKRRRKENSGFLLFFASELHFFRRETATGWTDWAIFRLLGEFSPIVLFFTWGRCFENDRNSLKFWAT